MPTPKMTVPTAAAETSTWKILVPRSFHEFIAFYSCAYTLHDISTSTSQTQFLHDTLNQLIKVNYKYYVARKIRKKKITRNIQEEKVVNKTATTDKVEKTENIVIVSSSLFCPNSSELPPQLLQDSRLHHPLT